MTADLAEPTTQPSVSVTVDLQAAQPTVGSGEHFRLVFEKMRAVLEVIVLSPDDWRMWRELRLAALAEAPDAFGSTLSEWSGAGDTEQRWRARLEEVALNLVLTCDGEAMGMVSATAPDGAHPVELISLWVAPSGRGHGVGDEAVRQIVAWVHENFPGSRVILSVKTSNHLAIGLYGRHGFVDVGPSPYGADERLMRL